MNMSINTTAASGVFGSTVQDGPVVPTTLHGLPGMSSLEIAAITGKDHSRVLKDVRKMLKELDLVGAGKTDASSFVETSYQTIQNKTQPMVILDKELTFTLITGYSITLRHLVVKRWSAMEFEKDPTTALKSVQETVVHLVEREKDSRQVALRRINRGKSSRQLTAQEKEMQRHLRASQRFERDNPMSCR